MNVVSLLFGLLVVLSAMLVVRSMRKLNPQIAGIRSQRICPACGLITARLNRRCLECGAAGVPSGK